MQPFTQITGPVLALDRADVDTDQIIPKQFLKRIERTGFEDYLFFDCRYGKDGEPDPNFELNRPESQGARVLLARRNFGCGSSREHAVWALENYGIRCVIAPSFADIFHNNCFKNGVLPIVLDGSSMDELFRRAGKGRYELTVDLDACRITDAAGLSIAFTVDESLRQSLLTGRDEIAQTLRSESRIEAYERRHADRLART
ncbi:MAG: 3-isopropylmalate dehydratase small subunit [Planctomycetes bacterium]|nr:3-isopropylmalate dehydratase small subunit [Planctomycetota bacterium]